MCRDPASGVSPCLNSSGSSPIFHINIQDDVIGKRTQEQGRSHLAFKPLKIAGFLGDNLYKTLPLALRR